MAANKVKTNWRAINKPGRNSSPAAHTQQNIAGESVWGALVAARGSSGAQLLRLQFGAESATEHTHASAAPGSSSAMVASEC